MRRILTTTLLVLVLTGIGVGVYFYFFASTPRISVAPPGSVSLPSASQGTTTSTTGGVQTNTPPANPVPVSVRLVKISAGPIVPGEVAVNIPAKDASSSPDVAVKYIERQSGNVFSYLVQAKTITRTSNKTIPGIESATWLPDASTAFVRYLSGSNFSTINTYALPATGSGGFFLPQDLAAVAVSPTSLLTLASGVNGSIGTLEHLDGTRATSAFTTPLSMLRVSFAGKNRYLAFTKPSATLAGDAFFVDSAGNFFRIAGPLNGLSALASPSGKWVLVSSTASSGMQMELVNTTTGETLQLPVATIADKCVWAADDSSIYCGVPISPSTNYAYPDDWYQGVVHFSDRIWRIDVAGRYAQLVLDFSKETSGSLDAQTLAVDPSDTTLVFMNKNDGSLWSYSL